MNQCPKRRRFARQLMNMHFGRAVIGRSQHLSFQGQTKENLCILPCYTVILSARISKLGHVIAPKHRV